MTTPSKAPPVADLAFLAAQKRWGLHCLSVPIYIIMFPQFYQNHLEKQLKPAEYHTLKALVYLLQSHKQVSIELLASFWPYRIQFESRRLSLQRFLKLDSLNIESL